MLQISIVLVLHLVMNRQSFKDQIALAFQELQTIVFQRFPCFEAKASAKVLLFFELTKYLRIFFALFLHFLCNYLIINGGIFWLFFGFLCKYRILG